MGEPVVLTSENSAAYYAALMNPTPEPAKAVESAEEKVSANAEQAAQTPQESKETDLPEPKGNEEVRVRFSELTEKRKAAEAEAETAKADAKASREARVLAEQRIAELQAKYEPPKPDELGPEPTREQFVNEGEFLAAVKDHAGEKALRERDQKEAQERIAKAWSERQAATKAEIPDYEETIAKASHLLVSNEVRDAILSSEVGPKILHHLATNPDVVADLAKMKTTAALLTIGRLDAKLSSAAEAKAPASAAPVAALEVSRAPAPITPLKGANAPVASPLDSNGVFHGTYADWKAARKAGKI